MKLRSLLIVAALVVVGLMVGLIVTLREADHATPPAPKPAAPATGEPAAPGSTPPPSAPEVEPRAARPVPLPPIGAGDAAGDGGPIVRDHTLVATPGPPSPIASVTIAEIRQVVEPAVRSCASGIQILNPPVRVMVHARLQAAGGRVSAHDVSVTGAEPLGDDFVACVKKAYQETQTDTRPEQTDGEDLVHMPWTFP